MIPAHYQSALDLRQTEEAIKLCKDHFERVLADKLGLSRVSAPLFVPSNVGLNDNLSGNERPVSFDILDLGYSAEIVHSLAKWKRLALGRYGFTAHTGLYTDMNAIRRDETLDNIHSLYVDQWDWEIVITPQDRTLDMLRATVTNIYAALLDTAARIQQSYPELQTTLPSDITFITAQALEDKYPALSGAERENVFLREVGAAFIIGIGGKLRSGKPHDSRAPDYDDWGLNGDLCVWNPLLQRSFELSSMGIRVDAASMQSQLSLAGCLDRAVLPFHSMVLGDQLPLTMGGGIGQSRLCMLLLQKAHIGEVQASLWPQAQLEACEQAGVTLL